MNTQTAGVWVKASERLPEVLLGTSKQFFVKDLRWDRLKVCWYGQSNKSLFSLRPNDIEWIDESIPTLTIQQALEVWDDACKDLLKDIAQVFLDKSNQAKADTLRDADVFQAVGETIENFPLRDKRTYFLYKFGIDIDKM